jgi:hypothetical protein
MANQERPGVIANQAVVQTFTATFSVPTTMTLDFLIRDYALNTPQTYCKGGQFNPFQHFLGKLVILQFE